jgi:conjugative relaxase-like TrwC/TraI family protein
MLTVSRIGGASRAAAYYGRDDYYRTGEADRPGLTWGGEGAARLGLRGQASSRDFAAVLDGSRLARTGGADPRHHPGWDFTFSAPKGVSVALLVGGDSRLAAAHDRAVAKAMDYAERRLTFTRRRENGTRLDVCTGNLVYAACVHEVSRAGDPQRHTHVIIANATFDKETGAWRALESRPLFQRRMLLGKIYQAELAKALLGLGYDVTRRRDGLFDLGAWTPQHLRAFSKRSQSIKQVLGQERAVTPSARETVKLKHRPRKLGLPREALVARWAVEAEREGLRVAEVVAEAKAREQGSEVTPQVSGRASDLLSRARSRVARWVGGRAHPGDGPVAFAIGVHEVRSAVFTRHAVLELALDRAPAGMALDALAADVRAMEASGRLMSAGSRLPDAVTTRGAVALEAELLRRIGEGRGRGQQLRPRAKTDPRRGIALNPDQALAVRKVVQSPDRYVAVQGSAGVGKTTMLQEVRDVCAACNVELTAVAPTHRAAVALSAEAGIRAGTIALWTRQSPDVGRPARRSSTTRWLLVDEASMISNAQMLAIMDRVDREDFAKIVLLGDRRQLGSPEAGAPFRLLLDAGVDQARMQTIIRQRDPNLRESVALLAAGRVHPSFRLIEDHVRELGRGAGDEVLARAAADAWRGGRAAGAEPRIVVPTNALRNAVSELVRRELMAEGSLGPGAKVQAYHQVRLNGPERFSAASYRPGQKLVFHASHASTGISRGREVDVVGIDRRNDVLRLAGPFGDCSLDLRALARRGRMPFEAYRTRAMEVAQGERLVWEKADAAKGRLTGAGFVVVARDRETWTIRHDDGRFEQLRVNDPALRFIGYGYAETADRAQGQTYRSVVAVMAAHHGKAVTAARQYVMQSRPSEAFQLITDDRKTLLMRLAAHDGLNRVAREHLEIGFEAALASKEGVRVAESPSKQQPSL